MPPEIEPSNVARPDERCARCGEPLLGRAIEYLSLNALKMGLGVLGDVLSGGPSRNPAYKEESVFICSRCARELEEDAKRPARQRSLRKMLAGLDALRHDGAISTPEFNERRTEILNELALTRSPSTPVRLDWRLLRWRKGRHPGGFIPHRP